MLTRLALAVALAPLSIPHLAHAQRAPVCDGSEMQRVEQRRSVGTALLLGTALADVVAVSTIPRNPEGATKAGSHFRFVMATAPIAIAGFLVANTASPGEGFWRSTVARLKVGETTSGDVRLCLHRPAIETSSGAEQRWTYVAERPAVIGNGGVIRTLHLTFRDSVLAAVSQTEVRRDAVASAWPSSPVHLEPERRRGFCTPPVPVVADPFPVATDTTAAAAAIARAQADADAAMKNAANAAAYAMCMASDSVR